MTDAYFFDAESPNEVKKRVDEFVHRCGMITRHVFHKDDGDAQAFRVWLDALIANSENPFLLLHDDPFYLVAEYYGVDMRFIENSTLATEYSDLARIMNW